MSSPIQSYCYGYTKKPDIYLQLLICFYCHLLEENVSVYVLRFLYFSFFFVRNSPVQFRSNSYKVIATSRHISRKPIPTQRTKAIIAGKFICFLWQGYYKTNGKLFFSTMSLSNFEQKNIHNSLSLNNFVYFLLFFFLLFREGKNPHIGCNHKTEYVNIGSRTIVCY